MRKLAKMALAGAAMLGLGIASAAAAPITPPPGMSEIAGTAEKVSSRRHAGRGHGFRRHHSYRRHHSRGHYGYRRHHSRGHYGYRRHHRSYGSPFLYGGIGVPFISFGFGGHHGHHRYHH